MSDISKASLVKLGNSSAVEMWFGGVKIWPTKIYWPGVSITTGSVQGFDSSTSSHAVAMNGSGDIVAVGIDASKQTTATGGVVKVFKFSNGAWSQMGLDITAPLASNKGDLFGYSLSLNYSASSSSAVLAVGAPGYGGAATRPNKSGYVAIYFWNGSAWSQNDGLNNSMFLYGPGYENVSITYKEAISSREFGSYDAYFGKSIQLSGDGKTLVVGSPNTQIKLNGKSSSVKGDIVYSISSGASYKAENRLIIYDAYNLFSGLVVPATNGGLSAGVRCYCSSFSGGAMTSHSSGVNNQLYANREYWIWAVQKEGRNDAIIFLKEFLANGGRRDAWWATPVTDLELVLSPNPTPYKEGGSTGFTVSGVQVRGGRVEVYKYNGGQWQKNGTIDGKPSHYMGSHVAINSEGSRIASTKPFARSTIYPTTQDGTGGCCVYDYISGNWTLTGDIEGSGDLTPNQWSLYHDLALNGDTSSLSVLHNLFHGGGGLAMNSTGNLIFIYGTASASALQIIKKVASGGNFYGLVFGNWESQILRGSYGTDGGLPAVPLDFPRNFSWVTYKVSISKNSLISVNQSGDIFALEVYPPLQTESNSYIYVYNNVNNNWAIKGERIKLGGKELFRGVAINSSGTRVATAKISPYTSSPVSTLNILDYSP